MKNLYAAPSINFKRHISSESISTNSVSGDVYLTYQGDENEGF